MKKILISFVCLLTAIAGYAAKTAKAVVSADETTLTFYYDDADHSSEGTVFALNEGYKTPGWYDYMGTITTAVFDESFKDARPTTTYMWFGYQKYNQKTFKLIYSALSEIRNIENLNTSEVTNMSGMFYSCKALESLGLSSFNTSNVTDMYRMFYGCEALKSLDISNFNTAKVKNMDYMFNGCKALKSIDLSNFNTTNVNNMSNMFYGCNSLTSLDLSNFNTANVTNMSYMFYDCHALKSIDISNFNTGKVTNMFSMFEDCKALTSLDLSSFNTANVESMSYMFSDCNVLTSLDLSNFNTANVTDMSYMFYDCYALKSINISSFNTKKVTNMFSMFDGCKALTSLDLSSFNTANVESMGNMFSGCEALTTIYVLENFVTTNVTISTDMFNNCTSLVGGAGTTYNSSYTDATYAKVDHGENDPGYFTYKPVPTAKAVVSNDKTTLTFYYDDADHSSEGTVCSLNEGSDYPEWYDYMGTITTAVFDASFKVVRPTTTYMWFGYQEYDQETYRLISSALSEIRNIENLNTSEVTNMSYMFYNCTALTSLDLSSFNTENVTDMGNMFYCCEALKSLDLRSFNTAKVENMSAMFGYCTALTSLDLSSFNTAKVTNMSCMFLGCEALTSLDLSSFNTAKVTNMNYMFYRSNALTSLDLSSFNTANVESMSNMLYGCEALKSLDLSSFNTENVTYMSYMFKDCKALTTIYTSENFVTTNLRTSNSMFSNCSSLVGGAGTKYNESYIDATYAKVDGGESNPGYFTYKADPFTLTIDESGYATFCSTNAVDFSDQTAFKAYIVSGYNKSTETTSLTQVNDAPAGTGILVIGTPGTYELTEATSAGIYSNFLIGVTEATTLAQTDGTNTNFVLSDGNEGYAFYKVDAASGNLAAGKAYLSLPTSAVAGAKVFHFAFEDEETTAISGISADAPAPKAIYNLSGQKVDDNYKGIVIINGKKIMKR